MLKTTLTFIILIENFLFTFQ